MITTLALYCEYLDFMKNPFQQPKSIISVFIITINYSGNNDVRDYTYIVTYNNTYDRKLINTLLKIA